MAYKADIEIAVRGARQLKDLQSEIKRTSEAVDQINKELNSVNDQTAVTFNSLSRTLSDARQAFNEAARGTGAFGDAINTLIRTEREYNNELRERNSLLAQARAAQTAAARTISPGPTGFSAEKFGPQVPAGTGRQGDPAFASSPVAERLSQQLSDQAKLKASLLALDEKSAAAARERLSLSTQLKEQLNDIKVAAKTGPREPEGFSKAAGQKKVADAIKAQDDSARRQQIMKEGAEFAAQQEANRKTTIESYNKVAQFAKKNEATVFGIRAKNIRKTLDLEFDKIAKQAAAEGKAADKLITKRISDINRAGKAFDKELNRRIKAQERAAENERRNQKRTTDAGRKRRNDAISSGLIGGAFPLLFGQGGGAAIGGGIGGFAGGLAGGQMGFALSLVGTQFGAFADQIVSGGATLGQALNPLTADIEALATAAGFAGTETGAALQAIEDLGTQQQALEAATALLAATVGNEGVDALNNFGADTADLGREFARAMTQMQVAAAQLFQSIPGFIANAIKAANDLQTGLNLDTPEAKELQGRREELTGFNIGRATREALGLGGLTLDELNEKAGIEARLMTLAQEQTAEAEGRIKLTAKELKHKALLQQLGIKDSKLQKIETNLAGAKADYTDKNFVNLTRQSIIRKADIKRAEALKVIGTDENGVIKDRTALLKINKQIGDESIAKQATLALKVDKALEAQNRKLTQGAAKAGKQTEQLARQEQQARNFTASLERQLAQSKVAGTQQAKKLRIEAKYEQTLERIAKLKNQDFAVEQAALANQIRTTENTNLELANARKRAEAIRSAVAPIEGIREGQEASLAASKEYNRLLMEGVLPSEAKRITEFNKQVDALLRQKDVQISILDAEIISGELNAAQTADVEKRIRLLKEQKTAIQQEAAKGPGASDTSDRKTIEDRVAQLQGELTEMTKLGNVAIAVADNVGAAFSTAFQSVVNGTKTTREALSDMFRTIGENFVAMAADIIAKQLVMITLQTILKALGAVAGAAGSGGGGSTTPPSTIPGGAVQTGPGLNIGGVDQGIAPKGFAANGGPVSGGQPYMVGERGPELFVPGQSGGVMRNEDMRSLMGRSPASGGAASMNFSFETTSIGGTEYVSREQLESAMAVTRKQASNDGAKRGMSMTLDKMQNSPRTRTRIGLR